MNKLIFYYGTMASGKSSMVLRLIHEFNNQNKNTLIIKPLISARKSTTKIVDRAGESYPVDIIENKDHWDGEFEAKVINKIKNLKHLDLVVADEAQFLEFKHIIQLRKTIHKYFSSTPIFMFGLLKDFTNHLFPTSKFLIENADDLREMKNVCWFCSNKATCNLRINNHHPVYSGKEIQIGGDDDYKPVCQYHFYHPNMRHT